jgi:3-phosphoshikimate 1-carboxyvinyltransferase
MNWTIKPFKQFKGNINVPADKSITHRAVMLAAIANGKSIIINYLDGEDCMCTVQAFRSMGVKIEKDKKSLFIEGVGLKGLKKPARAIDAGNSGTTVRLLSGILAGQGFTAEIKGDESLSKRPMKRVIEPLTKMGAVFEARENNYLPMKITGMENLKPIDYVSPVASAQVKSCILLAGLFASGTTSVTEPVKSRDHTERMLKTCGADINVKGLKVSVQRPERLKNQAITVPGDISSAAFFMALGAVSRSAKITVKNVGVNQTRDGIIEVFKKMNAKIRLSNQSEVSGEPVADIEIESSGLLPFEIDEDIIPRLIDEIPALVFCATQANGKSIISGAGELRVKESDRLKTITAELKKMGADIEEKDDGLIIKGPSKLKGAEVESYGDHRIAMTLAIAGLIAEGETIINNVDCVNTSFPGFLKKIEELSK